MNKGGCSSLALGERPAIGLRAVRPCWHPYHGNCLNRAVKASEISCSLPRLRIKFLPWGTARPKDMAEVGMAMLSRRLACLGSPLCFEPCLGFGFLGGFRSRLDRRITLCTQFLDQGLLIVSRAENVGNSRIQCPPSWRRARRAHRARAASTGPASPDPWAGCWRCSSALRSRMAWMVVRVVPISLPIAPSETSGWLRRIQAIPSGLS